MTHNCVRERERESLFHFFCSCIRRNSEPVTLTWKWMEDDIGDNARIEPFENFYLFEGRQIFDFINQTILKNIVPQCQLEGSKTAVYRLPDSSAYVCLAEGNDIDRTAQITELLSPWTNAARQTVAFSFQPAYSYNTTRESDKRCFVRSLCPKQTGPDDLGLPFVEPMEDCNMIYGVSAGGRLYISLA